jgi:hypothetical protein
MSSSWSLRPSNRERRAFDDGTGTDIASVGAKEEAMSTFIVTIFPDEAKAYEAIHVFNQLHTEGSITLFDTTVVQRQADGAPGEKRSDVVGDLLRTLRT